MTQDPQVSAVWLWLYALMTGLLAAMTGAVAVWGAWNLVTGPLAGDERWLWVAAVVLFGGLGMVDAVSVGAAVLAGWRSWNGDTRLVRPVATLVIVLGLLATVASIMTFSCCTLLLRPGAILAAVVALITCPRDLERSFGGEA